ncbi:MAG: hypothetical protein ACP5QT_04625 [Brevinematia bacterium]
MWKIFLLIFFFLIKLNLFSFEGYVITNSTPDFLPVILFKSIQNTSELNKYPLSDQFAEVFMGSIKNHLKPLKNVDIVYNLAGNKLADIVIKGEYYFYGDIKSPFAKLSIYFLTPSKKN